MSDMSQGKATTKKVEILIHQAENSFNDWNLWIYVSLRHPCYQSRL